MGHVTAAKARSKGDPESQLTLAFDKLNVANGKQLSVKGAVQAVFPPPDEVGPRHGRILPAPSRAGRQWRHRRNHRPDDGHQGRLEHAFDLKRRSRAIGSQVRWRAGNSTIWNSKMAFSVPKESNVKLGSGVRMIVHVEILG